MSSPTSQVKHGGLIVVSPRSFSPSIAPSLTSHVDYFLLPFFIPTCQVQFRMGAMVIQLMITIIITWYAVSFCKQKNNLLCMLVQWGIHTRDFSNFFLTTVWTPTWDWKCSLFQEDINLMHSLGVDSYRFSIAWARILPSEFSTLQPLQSHNSYGILIVL